MASEEGTARGAMMLSASSRGRAWLLHDGKMAAGDVREGAE
jgi:hypothetical protein